MALGSYRKSAARAPGPGCPRIPGSSRSREREQEKGVPRPRYSFGFMYFMWTMLSMLLKSFALNVVQGNEGKSLR